MLYKTKRGSQPDYPLYAETLKPPFCGGQLPVFNHKEKRLTVVKCSESRLIMGSHRYNTKKESKSQ